MNESTWLADSTRLFEYMSTAVLTVDENANILFINTAFEHLFAYSSKSLLSKHIKILISNQNRNLFVRKALINVSKLGHWNDEAWVKKSIGESIKCKITVDAFFDESRKLRGYIASFNPVTQHINDDTALQKLAYKDDLTGLANRALFNQLLLYEIGHAEREDNKFALLFIDLDKFKQVNDDFGHEAGDLLLCKIAQKLESCVRKTDVVARLGGDEFVIILNRLQDPDTISKVVEKIVREINKIDNIAGNSIEVACSVGISLYPDNGKTMPQLMQHADAAMYRAKKDGGNRYFYFSADINQEMVDYQKAKARIENGLLNHEFIPYFQPLIDARTKEVVGVECLARWQRDVVNVANPIEFISIAKKSGLLHLISTQVLNVAFAKMSHWKKECGFSIPLSVNMTTKQFCDKKTFDKVDELLDKHDLTGETIRVEVAESTLQEVGAEFIDELNGGKHANLSITLDDFGSGYSSLKTLQELPVDILKIDRSFVRNIDNNAQEVVIIKAIIQMAQTLGIYVVATGVETTKQRDFLLANGCYLMQGYLFSPPISADDFYEYINL